MAEQTAAFSGYRPQKLPEFCTTGVQIELSQLLKNQIHKSYSKGYRVFLNGMMSGWDIIAAEAVLSLRDSYADLYCVSIAPFQKSYFANANWTQEWKSRALQVYYQSDHAFFLSEHYRSGTYYTRNRYLVEHASLLIAYYDGQPGGTRYTCEYAAKMGLNIVNIATAYCGCLR